MKILLYVAAGLLLIIIALATWLYTPDQPRASIETKYHVIPADYRLVAGVRLHVVESGPHDAPALILLHGFSSSLQTWDGWALPLAEKFRVIRFDLPGFGLTGPDPTGDYSDARSLAVLLALMDQLGVEKASLIGNSLGGKIAWLFASTYPARVNKLVLISPDGFASPGFEYGKHPDVPWMIKLLPYVLPKPMLRASLLPAYGNPAHLTQATLDRYADMMRVPGNRTAMLDRMSQVMLVDPVPLLHKVTAPTLLLWGEKDGMIPFSNAADYLKAMPHARLVALPGLAHVPFEEAPAVSLAPVVAFLEN